MYFIFLFFLQRGCHILVATPGRLLDFTRRGRIKFNSLRFIVLDEADRMLDMGFLGDIETVMNHETMVPAVNFIYFLFFTHLNQCSFLGTLSSFFVFYSFWTWNWAKRFNLSNESLRTKIACYFFNADFFYYVRT